MRRVSGSDSLYRTRSYLGLCSPEIHISGSADPRYMGVLNFLLISGSVDPRYAKTSFRACRTRDMGDVPKMYLPNQVPSPHPLENNKIAFLSSSLLCGDRRCNQVPHALTHSIVLALIYCLIFVAPPFTVSVLPWMHHRKCSTVSHTYRLIIVNLRKNVL
ncbi:hypothetical protein PIB30_099050 [Stylosanthes scabra]|uniref:Uncharacterized protein n=1 Tax=Stylosanthes scabra TaxID=79078 RepID=A0ABU6XZ53_9FABA|nr:hypothetical protein [Stylosanthes scabra]